MMTRRIPASAPTSHSELAEHRRLHAIARLKLADATPEPILDQLVQEVCQDFDIPIALISIVTDSAQIFKARHGLSGWIDNVGGTPVEWSFCQYVVQDAAPFEVNSALQDKRVQSSPLVRNDGIRCYLGVPLQTSDDQTVGSLCIIGTETRVFTDAERQELQKRADRAMYLLEQQYSAAA